MINSDCLFFIVIYGVFAVELYNNRYKFNNFNYNNFYSASWRTPLACNAPTPRGQGGVVSCTGAYPSSNLVQLSVNSQPVGCPLAPPPTPPPNSTFPITISQIPANIYIKVMSLHVSVELPLLVIEVISDCQLIGRPPQSIINDVVGLCCH